MPLHLYKYSTVHVVWFLLLKRGANGTRQNFLNDLIVHPLSHWGAGVYPSSNRAILETKVLSREHTVFIPLCEPNGESLTEAVASLPKNAIRKWMC